MISLQFLHLVQIPSGICTFLVSTGAMGAFVLLNQAISLPRLLAGTAVSGEGLPRCAEAAGVPGIQSRDDFRAELGLDRKILTGTAPRPGMVSSRRTRPGVK